jgi:post-segregation antitoxin (ccd killing protein)
MVKKPKRAQMVSLTEESWQWLRDHPLGISAGAELAIQNQIKSEQKRARPERHITEANGLTSDVG